MTASDLVENPVNLFILCESLRQLQKIKSLPQKEPEQEDLYKPLFRED